MKIACVGAGYVGGPTMAVIAMKCPDVEVTVTDVLPDKIAAWNSPSFALPIFEPGLADVVREARGRNLFFSTDIEGAIKAADVVFVCVPTPTKTYGVGMGSAPDLKYIEACARTIASVSDQRKIVVEKSTVPVKCSDVMIRIFAESKVQHSVLSNPEFLAEGTAISDLQKPDRVLIGGESETEHGRHALETLVSLYSRWVPRERVLTTNLWSSELSKLVANAFLAQRISSINAVSELCEVTGADVQEVARSIGMDSRIGPNFLKASVGFGGSCFKKDILNLTYICSSLGLDHVAAYWRAVVDMNSHQKERFSREIVRRMFNTISGKRIAILGFAFKKDTGDTRESAAIAVCTDLLVERANLAIFDPKVEPAVIARDLKEYAGEQGLTLPIDSHVTYCTSAAEAAKDAHALVILTEWNQFRSDRMDYASLYAGMVKPAFLFDGRLIVDHQALVRMGFEVHAVGKKIRG